MQLLLKNGVNHKLLVMTLSEGHKRIIQCRLRYNWEIDDIVLLTTSSRYHEKAVQFLLNNGVNVNDSSLQASREGYEKTMQWLLDEVENMNVEEDEGENMNVEDSSLQVLRKSHDRVLQLLEAAMKSS